MAARQIPAQLGLKLRVIRQHLGYTLDEMGESVGRQDLGRRSRVLEWENGIRQPDLETLLAYARLVNVSTDVLIDDEIQLEI